MIQYRQDAHLLNSNKGFRQVQRFEVDQDIFYQIISNQHEFALCRQPKARKYPQARQKICGDLQNSTRIQQLWMIKHIPNTNHKFEIIHFLSDNVMDINEDGEIILTKGKQRNEQLFEIQASFEVNKLKQEIIRIKTSNGQFLYLNGILHTVQGSGMNVGFSLKKIQLFDLPSLKQTYLFISGNNRKNCLDLDRQLQKQQGNNIIVYEVHYRANQRWEFQPKINESIKDKQSYCIRNFLTKKYICYDKKQLRDSSEKDQWILQDLHTSKFLTAIIRHKKTGKYLGINQSGKVVLHNFKQIWEFCNQKMILPYSC